MKRRDFLAGLLGTVVGGGSVFGGLLAGLRSSRVYAGEQPLNSLNLEAIAALPQPYGAFRFAVLGDSRSGDATYARLLGLAEDQGCSFILHTGDMVNHGYSKEYEHYAAQLAGLDLPIVHVPGNHEVTAGRDNYERFVGDWNWSFDYGGWRFIGLDNSGGGFGQREFDFAGDFLDPQRPTFVSFHKPPRRDRWIVHAMDSDKNGGRGTEMLKLLARADVRGVFLGHIHLYDELKLSGLHCVISAGGGAGLYSQYGFGRPEYGLLLVEVENGAASWEWLGLEQATRGAGRV